jgi:hypothetical protein
VYSLEGLKTMFSFKDISSALCLNMWPWSWVFSSCISLNCFGSIDSVFPYLEA